MAAQEVVRRLRGGRQVAPARRVHAVHVAAVDHHPGFVQRGPVPDAVAQARGDDARVVREPVRAIAGGPAAALVQRLRQVPVEQGRERRDAGREQAVDQPVVEVEPGSVHAAGALGQHAAPGDAEAVGAQAQFAHQRDILAPAPVVVAGDVAGVAACDAARLVREHVPVAGTGAVGQRRALDLVGRRGGSPEEPGGKSLLTRCLHQSRA